jgi:Na+/proline symporter
MIREDLRQLKAGPRELRKFGLLVGGVFLLLALWFGWRGRAIFPYLTAVGGVLFGLGAVAPRVLRHVYVAWMAVALVLGIVVSTTLLTVFYYVVVTPVGLAARVMGKDFLTRRREPKASSYWILRDRSRPKSPQEYEQQY